MFRNNRIAAAIATLGAVVLVAHAVLGAAGVMTAAQWQSGAAIGGVLLLIGGGWLVLSR